MVRWVRNLTFFLAMIYASVAGGGITVQISERDCRWLTQHVPADDVAYRPGVDVKGRAVAPADLNAYGSITAPDQIYIGLDVPLRVFLEDGGPQRLREAEVNVGHVVVDLTSNRVFYNGRPLSDPDIAQLAVACRNLLPGQSSTD